MKNLFYDSRSKRSDPDILAKIRTYFMLFYGPDACELMIDLMTTESRNYSTPIERRALANLENLQSYNYPTKDSIWNTLTDKPNHS